MGGKFSGNNDLLASTETCTCTCPMLTVNERLFLRELIFERNKLTYLKESHFCAVMSKDNDKILLVGLGFENNCSLRCFVNEFVLKNGIPEEEDNFRPIGVHEMLPCHVLSMIFQLYNYMKKNGIKHYSHL